MSANEAESSSVNWHLLHLWKNMSKLSRKSNTAGTPAIKMEVYAEVLLWVTTKVWDELAKNMKPAIVVVPSV